MSDPSMTNGPHHNGSQSLARESKVGQAVTFVVSTLALGAAGWLGNLDLSTLPGWLVSTATVAVGTVIGLLTAYGTKNRKNYVGKDL